jgi:hypothetical protein
MARVVWLTDRVEVHQRVAQAAAPTGLTVAGLRRAYRALLRLLGQVDFPVSGRSGVMDADVFRAGRGMRLTQRLGVLTFDIDLEAARGQGSGLRPTGVGLRPGGRALSPSTAGGGQPAAGRCGSGRRGRDPLGSCFPAQRRGCLGLRLDSGSGNCTALPANGRHSPPGRDWAAVSGCGYIPRRGSLTRNRPDDGAPAANSPDAIAWPRQASSRQCVLASAAVSSDGESR